MKSFEVLGRIFGVVAILAISILLLLTLFLLFHKGLSYLLQVGSL